jgi:hypothetical protein
MRVMEDALTLFPVARIESAGESLDVHRSGLYRTQGRENTPSPEPGKNTNFPRSRFFNERLNGLNILHADLLAVLTASAPPGPIHS